MIMVPSSGLDAEVLHGDRISLIWHLDQMTAFGRVPSLIAPSVELLLNRGRGSLTFWYERDKCIDKRDAGPLEVHLGKSSENGGVRWHGGAERPNGLRLSCGPRRPQSRKKLPLSLPQQAVAAGRQLQALVRQQHLPAVRGVEDETNVQ